MEKIKQPTVIEQIKSGEIKGREALRVLQNTEKYVFHGSWQKLRELEPRQAYNDKKTDGEPAVCASNNYEISIFRSLVHTPICKTRNNFSGWSTNKEDGLIFRATEGAMESADTKNAIGYVHVFKKTDFKKYSKTEYRMHEKIEPLFVIEVYKDDLPEKIEILAESPL